MFHYQLSTAVNRRLQRLHLNMRHYVVNEIGEVVCQVCIRLLVCSLVLSILTGNSFKVPFARKKAFCKNTRGLPNYSTSTLFTGNNALFTCQ